jgi:hypothetical protein
MILTGLFLFVTTVFVVNRFLASVRDTENAALHQRLLREQARVRGMRPDVWLRSLPGVKVEGGQVSGFRADKLNSDKLTNFSASDKHNRRGVLV